MKTPTPVHKKLKLVAPLASLLLVTPAQATVFTYNTNNGTSNWSAASSWDTGVGPNGVGAVLSRTASANVTLAQDIASVTLGTITLASNCLWTINTGTNQLILDGGGSGAVIENASTGAGASLMLTTSSNSSLVIADDLLIKQSDANSTASGTAATARYAIQLNQRLVGTKSITVTNVLNDLNYGLVCLGGGNTAAGTYTGAITVAKGAMTWTSNTAFGSTSGITLGSTGGGDVSLVSVTNVASVGSNITVAANTGGKTVLGSTLATGAQKFGNIVLNQGLTVISQMTTADTAGVELNGVVSGTGGLQINGTVTISKVSTDTTGVVKMSGTNTFTGDTRVYKGTLLLGAASTGTNSLALQYSTLNLDSADSGTVGFGLNSSTTINSATLGGLSGSRDLALQNINTTSKAVALSVGKNNTDTTYTGALTGAGSLTKIGTGTLTLGGINTYTGQTKVNSGQLNLTGTSTSSAFTVGASAGLKINGSLVGTVTSAGVVSGTGAISGATIITGTLAPGNSVGTINTGDLSLAGGGTLAVELGRNESNVAVSDLASVNGAVDLTGANLQLQVYTGYTNPLVGDIYFLINNDGKTDAITGTFTTLDGVTANLTEGSRFTWNSQQWEITYTANYDTQTLTGGNDLAIIAVPEPGTWAMVLGGLGTLLAGQRLRRRS